MKVKLKSNYEINRAGFGLQQNFENQNLVTLINHDTGMALSLDLERARKGLTVVSNETLTAEAYRAFQSCFQVIDLGP